MTWLSVHAKIYYAVHKWKAAFLFARWSRDIMQGSGQLVQTLARRAGPGRELLLCEAVSGHTASAYPQRPPSHVSVTAETNLFGLPL